MSTQNQAAHDAARVAATAVDQQGSNRCLPAIVEPPSAKSAKNMGVGGGFFDAQDMDEELRTELENFKPLTRQEADDVRRGIQPVSMVQVLAVQAVAGVLVAMITWVVTGRQVAGWSAFYGALAVIAPAALFARGLSRQKSALGAGSALVGFFVWELVKIGTTVAMLLVAPRLVPQLSWLALLAGFVVTMKVYWLATWLQLARTKSVKKI